MGDFRRALAMLGRNPSIGVVELSALREHELEPLVTAVESKLELDQFSYVAVHAPSAMSPSAEKHCVESLMALCRRGWPVIVHPDAIHDWMLWRAFGDMLCVENMDKRKPIGRTCRELIACFDNLPDASLCLDLGHARQVDPTMTEAVLILKELGGRLKQVHLSEVNTDSTHDRISFTAATAFGQVAGMIPAETPIVLETPVEEEQLASEIRRANVALQPISRHAPGQGLSTFAHE